MMTHLAKCVIIDVKRLDCPAGVGVVVIRRTSLNAEA